MDAVVILNAGSSSLKFQLFAAAADGALNAVVKGQVDGIGTAPRLHATGADGAERVDRPYGQGDVADAAAATEIASSWLHANYDINLIAVGHRVVHGGPELTEPMRVDGELIARLERYIPLAPLHQPSNLAPIRALYERRPDLPQVACFDTACHRGHPPLSDHYAVPRELHAAGVRRYGFHGLSYEYVAGRLGEIAPELARKKVVIAHLGSGTSMCALAEGCSVDSTMGFTALDGLPMGTRSGHIDPGVLLYLLTERSMSAAELQDFLYLHCGLKGLSGISNDVRDLLASPDPQARFALDYFVAEITRHLGSLAAVLGGIDALVFTAGIGENSPIVRARVVERLGWLGARLDPKANDDGETIISLAGSRVAVLVVPTDEELVIARHTLRLLGGGSA
jgi:acetate kinase